MPQPSLHLSRGRTWNICGPSVRPTPAAVRSTVGR